jgi:hypothetical protein
MGSPNQPRDSLGRWSSGGSGSETGDHLSVSPSLDTRNVSGMNVPRSQVVARHQGAVSVGTAPPTVRLDGASSPSAKRGLGSARSDRITQLRAIDQRHFGIEGDIQSRVNSSMKPARSSKGWPFNN